jgi:hypothetical protein
MFYIDSQNRTSGSAGNFSINLAMPPNNRYDRIVVMQAAIPKSFYLVSAPYNTFQLLETGTSSSGSATNMFGSVSSNGATKTITLAEGNYSKTNMIVCLQTMLSLASSLNSTLATQYVYTVGYPLMNQPNTGKFTYTVTNLTTSQPQIIFPAGSTLYLPMGFNRASTNIFSNNILPSQNVICLQAKDTIFIKSNIVASSNKSVLQEIYTTANPDFSLIIFNQNDVELNSKELLYKDNNYTFSITDEDDNILNFNGQDVIFSICCYEYNNSLELLKNDILINNIQKLMN